MEPVFARLGVKHQSRNFGNGGLGTGHNGIAAGDIYGPDVSLLMWDSGMTESNSRDPDLMARQGLIGGIKVPVLWSFPTGVLKNLKQFGDVDVGAMNPVGSGFAGIPQAQTVEDLANTVWAARYLSCADDIKKDFCGKNKLYNGTCWIDREDYTPTTKQNIAPGGRAGWHPGNRHHQLSGRVLAFTLLKALHEVLTTWSEAQGQIMPDEAWHLTKYYETIRSNVIGIAPKNSPCYQLKDLEEGYAKFCYLPMKVRIWLHSNPTVYSCASYYCVLP
jgi:hypothetical protein